MEKCPACGYVDNSALLKNKPVTAAVNTYVNPKTGKVDGIYNSDDEKMKVGSGDSQYEVVRQDVWEKMSKTNAPIAPPTPPKEPVKEPAK